jgi:hypothetical protein
MDNDRAFNGRLSDQTAYPFAAIVVLALAGIIGVGLVTSEGVEVAPAASHASLATATSIATPKPSLATPKARIALGPTLRPSLFPGLIGLPPEDAEPSAPEVGELIETYPVDGGGPPYRGAARLYADGRLIWNRYFGGGNSQTTGYLEQRLTPSGVELVRAEKSLPRKDPLVLLDRLALDAFEARWPVPYVPTGYGVCLGLVGLGSGDASGDDTPMEPLELIEMLPEPISGQLRGRGFVSALDFDPECLAVTTQEARVLEGLLRDAGFDQDAFINNFTVQYAVDVQASSHELWVVFEPRFPDGSIGCSACG